VIVGDRSRVDGGFDWNNWSAGRVRYFENRVAGACVRTSIERELRSPASLVARRRVWTVGNEVWVVARDTGRCELDASDAAKAVEREP